MNPMYSRLIDSDGKYADPTSDEVIRKIQDFQAQYTEKVEITKKRSFEFTFVDKKGHKTGVVRYY